MLDNLSTWHHEAVHLGELVEADLRDPQALDSLFSRRQFDAAMHFCARPLVGESVVEPYA